MRDWERKQIDATMSWSKCSISFPSAFGSSPPPAMKIKTVLWDVDGTLLNTQEGLTAAYRYTIEQCHLPFKTDEELRSYIGPTPQTIFMTHFGLNKEDAQHAADIFRKRYKSHDLFKASLYSGVEATPKATNKPPRPPVFNSSVSTTGSDFVTFRAMPARRKKFLRY